MPKEKQILQNQSARYVCFLACLLFAKPSVASLIGAMAQPNCDYRGMAKAVGDGQIQKAYELSVDCEKLTSLEVSFRDAMLRNQYLETAQILAMQGKLNAARDHVVKARALAENFLVDSIESATMAFIQERSVTADESIRFYQTETGAFAKSRLAILYLDRNQPADAADAARAALKDDPANTTALVVVGALLEKTDAIEALATYKRAVASAASGNPSQSLIRYLELPRATAAIARLGGKR